VFNMTLDEQIQKLADMILGHRSAVVFTGAGISTDSGIPDYRTPGSGSWEKYDSSIVSIQGFLRDPTQYFNYALEMYPIRSSAKPNKAHLLVAKLEKEDLIKGVITQNVDGLHLEAGSSDVHELHGSLRRASCLQCGQIYSMDDIIQRVQKGENPPICEEFEGQPCQGLIKPTAVFFGEALPKVPWDSSVDKCKDTTLMIVVGSSLQVSPANSLPDVALKTGSELVIIDLMDTPFDSRATLLINERAVLVAELLEKKMGL
jgi:NAD-dependent deacetylase